MGPDLTDKRWIVAKGILFAILAIMAGALQLLADLPLWQESTLLLTFHVLANYIAPGMPSAGVMDLLMRRWRR